MAPKGKGGASPAAEEVACNPRVAEEVAQISALPPCEPPADSTEPYPQLPLWTEEPV